jgi:DNA-binding XRE family transcriptional regulator
MNSEEQFYIELGAKIASVRNDKDISQEVLAEFLKLSRPSIANIEKV